MQFSSSLSRFGRPAMLCALAVSASLLAPSSSRAGFDSPTVHTTPAWPQTLAIADFDGDGDRDILVFGNTALQLFVNSGTGSFTARPVQSGLWPGPSHDGAASDLDGDGDVDLTIAISDFGDDGELDGTGRIGVLLNGGNGSFGPAAIDEAPGTTVSVVAADVDGDLDPDIASTGNHIAATLFLNDGAGGLSLGGNFGSAFEPVSLEAGDLDNDGDVDLAVAMRLAGQVGVLKNAGNGTYAPTVTYQVAGRNLDVLMFDADQDGFLDLASANLYSKTLSLLINRGDGTFEPEVRFSPGVMPIHLAAADFDGDQFPDIAIAGLDQSSVTLLLGNGGGFDPPVAVPAVQNVSRVVQADLDGDDRPDLAVLSNVGSRLAILRNNGAAFPPPPPPAPPIVLSVAGTNAKSRTVDLRWTGASGTNVVVDRNGIGIVSTPNDGQHTDSPPSKGTFQYQVCEPQPRRCSNQVMVSFKR
jgi:FG-GAP-like repeat